MSVALMVAAILVGTAAAAGAHDVLFGTSPADGSVAAVVPSRVTLTFDQPALAVGTEILVTGPAGQVQNGAAVLVDNTVTEHVQPGSPAGRYTVAWRVTSADGHPVSGRFSFTATSPSPGHRANSATAPPQTSVAGKRSTPWWAVAGGVLLLWLLLVVVVLARARRTATRRELTARS
jgi:methionine-rich copper-binding protein CopC